MPVIHIGPQIMSTPVVTACVGTALTTAPPLLRGPTRASQLPVSTILCVYDVIAVFEGTPSVGRSTTLTALLAAAGASPANSELAGTRASKRISALPAVAATYTDDWVLINQGTPPTTRRLRISDLLALPASLGA